MVLTPPFSMKHIIYLKQMVVVLLVSITFASCASLRTASFDQHSYQKAVEIKVEASRLMDLSVTPFINHADAVQQLRREIATIVEYEKNKPNNEITYAMWQLLSDEEKNLLSGFFKRWESKGQLQAFFVAEAKPQVLEALDLLIQYEGKKDPAAKDRLLQLISTN